MFDIGNAGPWLKLALELGGQAYRQVTEMAQARGAEVVDRRDQAEGSYRYWDPETLRVDKELEDFFIRRLEEYGIDALVLSEEAGRMKIEPHGAPAEGLEAPVFFISDPFDGSLLYKRNIPAFWYSALSIYSRPSGDEQPEPLAAVVADCAKGEVFFCDTACSYRGGLSSEEELAGTERIAPNETSELSDAFLETYLMKPHYLYPTTERFKFLLEGVKFVLPNGGPAAFCDVACGRVDIYLAHMQPHTDIFPGLAVAEREGCPVTTFEGRAVDFSADVARRFNVVCSANETLHAKVLDLLESRRITDRLGLEED